MWKPQNPRQKMGTGIERSKTTPYLLFLPSSSGCLVPSTGVEGLLLALWESLVAFPVL